jgi:hypothetical protein
MEDRIIQAHDLAGEDSDRTMVVVSSPSIVYALQINTEAWAQVVQSFRNLGKAAEVSFELIKPILKEANAAMLEYREEMLREWGPAQNFFFDDSTRARLVASMEALRKERDAEILRHKAELIHTNLPFETPCVLEDLDPKWLAIVEAIEKEQKEQKQLHKKKGKKVKNWEHNKFWQGRK